MVTPAALAALPRLLAFKISPVSEINAGLRVAKTFVSDCKQIKQAEAFTLLISQFLTSKD
jgi:hypothetical protein